MQLVYVLQESKLDQEWNVRACPAALTSTNPIRELLESLSVLASKKKEKISLAQGDPTAFGHLKVPDAAVEAMVVATKSYMYNGYTHSAGSHECRKYALIFILFPQPFPPHALSWSASVNVRICITTILVVGVVVYFLWFYF